MTAASTEVDVVVVVTAHEHQEFLAETLASIAEQSVTPKQVVVVDDASSDDTPAIARRWCSTHGWTFLGLSTRHGVARARGAGAGASDAARLLFVDGDDVLDAGALQAMCAALDAHDDWAFAYPTVHEFGASERVTPAADFDVQRLARSNFVPATALMSRELYDRLGGFEHRLDRVGHEDWDFWIRAARAGLVGGPAPDAVLRWRRHPGAVSRNARSGRRWVLVRTVMWWRHRGFCPPPNPAQLVRRGRRSRPSGAPQRRPTREGAAPDGPVDVTAVVVAHHRPESLDRLLNGLGGAASQVVVVNVGGDAAVDDVTRRHGADPVAVANDGYAAAVNAGVRAARSPVVCFMNDDLVVPPATLADIAATAHRDQTVVLPLVVDAAGDAHTVAFALPTPWALLIEWALTPDRPPTAAFGRWRLEKWRAPATDMAVCAGTAAIVAAPTDVLRSAPLPEQYFLYWEELDWFWQLDRAGVDVVLRGGATVTHDGGRDDVRAEKCELMARNAVRCVRSTQGRTSAAVSWPIVVLWWTRLWVSDALRHGPRSARGAARLAGLRAALRAWREIR